MINQEGSLRRILTSLLRGVCRFSVRNSVRLQELQDALKRCLVEASIEELKAKKEPVTAARISLMSGVHRKDVTALIKGAREDLATPESLVSKVIGLWRGHKSFLTEKGKPKPLQIRSGQISFYSLVYKISKELNPSLILTELERVGAVDIEDGIVTLSAKSYIPKGSFEKAMGLAGQDCADLINTVEQNLSGIIPIKNLHLKTDYDGIPDELLDEVRIKLLKMGAAFHEKVSKYLSTKDKDINPKLQSMLGRNRVALGTFSICEK